MMTGRPGVRFDLTRHRRTLGAQGVLDRGPSPCSVPRGKFIETLQVPLWAIGAKVFDQARTDVGVRRHDRQRPGCVDGTRAHGLAEILNHHSLLTGPDPALASTNWRGLGRRRRCPPRIVAQDRPDTIAWRLSERTQV